MASFNSLIQSSTKESRTPEMDSDEECERYCVDMVEYDIFSSIESNQNTSTIEQFNTYCIGVRDYNIYHLQFIAKLIQNAPSYLLFDLLHPYFESLLDEDTQNKLYNGIISNGINGQTLPFIDQICLREMGICHIKQQNLILNAINKIYFIFNTCYDFTSIILEKYLSYVPEKLRNALMSYHMTGEALMFIDKSWLKKIAITNPTQQNIILNAINNIFNCEMFSTYISTYPLLRRYQHLFFYYKIDLNTFRNNCNSHNFYTQIGITNRFIVYLLKSIFSTPFKARIKCCNCTEIITFSDLYELNRKCTFYKANKYGLKNIYISEIYRLSQIHFPLSENFSGDSTLSCMALLILT
eukprot:418497_1